jgi:type IV pilus assembly protein PilE
MNSHSQRGVTLIELLMVVVIIGILTVIAVPSYREQVNKGNRAETRALLYEVLQKEERFYTENGTFTTTLASLGYPAALQNPHKSHTITLAVGATAALATSVNVVATANNDGKCATMTLANSQQTSATGTDPSTCW